MRCGNCGHARDGSRSACACIPSWVWREPVMVAAVRERDAQRVIQFLRRRVKNLSQEALARMCGVAQSTITRAEAGRGLTDRRRAYEALRGLGALGTEQLPARSGAREVPRSTFRKPVPGQSSDVEELALGLLLLERDYQTVPSTVALAQAGELHGRLTHHPGLVRHSTTQKLRARSCLLMGKLVWDASQRRESRVATAYLDEAIATARAVSDEHTLAQALLRKSFIPLYNPTGDHHLAMHTAHQAMRAAPETPELQALAALHVSEAHARLARPREASRYLDIADDYARTDQALDNTAWEGRRLRIAGSVYLALGRPTHARDLLEQAADQLSERPKSRGIVLANLALAHVGRREPDAAATALNGAMDVAHTTRAGGATSLIATALKELNAWRTAPAVAEVQGRFIDLLTR